MGEARERVIAALVALLVQVIILLAGLSVYLVPEPSTVEGGVYSGSGRAGLRSSW